MADHKNQKGKDEENRKGEPQKQEMPSAPPGEEHVAAAEKEEAQAKEPSPVEELQAQLEAKAREAADCYDKWLRSVAELDNYRKRVQKEKADLLKFGNESLLKAILPTLDNLERALEHGRGQAEDSAILDGVKLSLKQLLNTLEKFGVKPISAAGENFDPEKHEAVSQVPSKLGPNRVVAEVEKGYMFHDRLLRPAKVTVSKSDGEQDRSGS